MKGTAMANNPSQRLDPEGSPAKAGNGQPSAGPERIPSSTGTGHDFVRTILRMRAMEGSERAFKHDLREAMDEISHEPGILRQDLMRDADDPRTFLIISDWTDRITLEEFGRSDRRDRIMAPVRAIRESAERHTYEALRSIARRGPGIRVMVTVTVGEGEEEAYERAYLKAAKRVRMTPGHVQEELLWEPGTRTFHIFAEWEDEQSFNAWLDNPAHLEQTGPLVPYMLAGDFKRTIYRVRARPGVRRHTPEPAGEKAPLLVPTLPEPLSAPRDDAGPRVDAPAIAAGSAWPAADVLIVGAGPTGLTAAIELARRGIACRVIDKRTEPSAQAAAKAIGIQCRTMEILENIGIAREAMDAGIWLNGQTMFVNGRKTHQIDWNFPGLPYGHLGLPQHETERLLANCLTGHGVSIERGVKLCGLVQDAAGVTAHVRRGDQDIEPIHASYVVGCDGAQSAVRELLGLTFEGGMGMFPQLFMLGDVEVEWPMPEGHLLRFVRLVDNELRGMLVCVPLPGHRRYRVATLAPRRLQEEIGGPVPPGFSREYAPPALADIQAAIDELAPAGTQASNLRWSSIFRIKHGIVDRYRVGRVFVAGDAAHLHPPAGGQGMNTGIQDAWNLGWKLALAVRGEAAPRLLDSYEAERRPAGKEIVDRAVRIAFTDEIDMDDERRQFLTDMQMTLSYAESPLVGEAMSVPGVPGTAPAPGDRAPDANGLRRTGAGHPLRVFDLTRGTSHTLLLYADASVAEEDVLRLEALADSLRELCAGQLNAYVLLSPETPMPAGLELPVLQDADDQFRVAYGVTGASAYLIRPDGHVGFRSSPIAATALRKHLEGVFTIPSNMASLRRAEGSLER
jgi:2-polyprenyl-6-methoxyphenol hydroxylase-like FAD-dependent oxidoreductase/quinol monooxygenase YgiN